MAGEAYNGVKIGTWFRHQKNDYIRGKLDGDHELALRAIGVDLDRSLTTAIEERWQYNYALLREFVEINGRMPAQRETHKGENIGVWLLNQKAAFKKGKLSPEREQLLRDVGVEFLNKYDM